MGIGLVVLHGGVRSCWGSAADQGHQAQEGEPGLGGQVEGMVEVVEHLAVEKDAVAALAKALQGALNFGVGVDPGASGRSACGLMAPRAAWRRISSSLR